MFPYPTFWIWWNPVVHAPLSGAVTQEFVQKVEMLQRQYNRLSNTMAALGNEMKEKGIPLSQELHNQLKALTIHIDTPGGDDIKTR